MDPIVQTFVAFAEAIMENPMASGFVLGLIRSTSGWIQKRWYEKTGKKYDPKILGATVLKYEVAVNAVSALIPPKIAAPIVLVADIVFSATRKMKKG